MTASTSTWRSPRPLDWSVRPEISKRPAGPPLPEVGLSEAAAGRSVVSEAAAGRPSARCCGRTCFERARRAMRTMAWVGQAGQICFACGSGRIRGRLCSVTEFNLRSTWGRAIKPGFDPGEHPGAAARVTTPVVSAAVPHSGSRRTDGAVASSVSSSSRSLNFWILVADIGHSVTKRT